MAQGWALIISFTPHAGASAGKGVAASVEFWEGEKREKKKGKGGRVQTIVCLSSAAALRAALRDSGLEQL